MSQSSNLYRLQLVDSQLDKARNRIAEIDDILSQEEELQLATKALEEARQNLSNEQKNLQRAEAAVQDMRIKIEQNEAMLYGGKVRNPKELQDLQAESISLKKHLITLEDRELEAMITLENTEQQMNTASQELDSIQSKLSSQFSLLNGERHSLNEHIQKLDIERQAAINTTSVEDMAIYEQLRKQRRGIAVAKVVDKSCSACGSPLTPALVQQAITSPALVRCPTCSRIIYPG